MFDINASTQERECYQKWNKLMKQHRHRNVRQPYYQQGRMDAWEREYTRLQEEMRREMGQLRKERLIKDREEILTQEILAKTERQLRREAKKREQEKAEQAKKRAQEKARLAKEKRAQERAIAMENPRRSIRLARK